MRILSHYFVARFLGLFATVLLAAFAILATVELVLNLEELRALPPPPPRANPLFAPAQLLWTRMASTYLGDLIGFAVFAASFLTFALAGRRLEQLAIEASGVRPLRMILPVVLAATTVALGAFGFEETVVLRARHIRLAEDRAESETLDFERRGFWYHRGPILTNVGHADPATRTLHDVELFERGQAEASGRILRIVRAARVRILDDGTWRFDDASVWLFDEADPAARPRFERHRRYPLDLESLPRHTLADADPAIAPLDRLGRHLARARAESRPPDHRLAAAYHERASSPLRRIALCLLALPFGLRVDPRGHIASAAGWALLALALFLAATLIANAVTRLGWLPIGWASWGVPSAFAAVALAGLARRGV